MVDESIDIKSQDYNEYVNKTVRASDDKNIGKVEAVNKDIFVIKKGFIKLHYYYIPISKVKEWDDKVLWLKIKETEVKEKYERNKPPDPYRYYVKDYPYYTAGYFPPLAVIKSKWISSKYHKKGLNALEYSDATKSTMSSKKSTGYTCDLCTSKFSSPEKLSSHIISYHN
jgi:hypothetical protein